MLRTFLAYTSLGVDKVTLGNTLSATQDAFGEIGITAYCSSLDPDFDRDDFTTSKQLMQEHAFPRIRTCHFLFAINITEQKGEHMLMEVGCSLENRVPVLVAQRRLLEQDTRLVSAADKVFTWSEPEDLAELIRQTDFSLLGLSDGRHPTHRTRVSMSASSYDEICELCSHTDAGGRGWGRLREPCPASVEEREKYDQQHQVATT